MPRGVYDRSKGAAKAAPISHEAQGTSYDAGAAGYELQGRASEPTTGVEPVTEAVALNETEVTEKIVAMELHRHYVPKDLRGIIGYQKEAVLRKNSAGQMVEVEKAEFIDGIMKPPVYPGSGFPNKIWAGTVIQVPEAEAKEMRTKKIAEAYI